MTLPTTKKKYVEFSFSINKISEDYSNLQIHLESTDIDVTTSFQLIVGDVQEVEKG